MNVFRVTSERRNAQGQPVWFLFECTQPDLETLTSILNDSKLVIGKMLWTKRGQDEEGLYFEITGDKTIALGKGGVAVIETVADRCIRFVD